MIFVGVILQFVVENLRSTRFPSNPESRHPRFHRGTQSGGYFLKAHADRRGSLGDNDVLENLRLILGN